MVTNAMTEEDWELHIRSTVHSAISSLPMNVPDEALKRSSARLKLAFLRAAPTSKIHECHPESVALCIVQSAMTGLYPGGPNPDVDLIPRKDKHRGGGLFLSWQISYRGYIRLCRRNPGWNVHTLIVYAGETFNWGEDSERGEWFEYLPRLDARDKLGDPKAAWDAIQLAVPVVRSPAGITFTVLSKGQIQQRRDCARDQSFWDRWPVEKVQAMGARHAGQRELFPCDDPARYALTLDIQQETGEGDALTAALVSAPLTAADLAPAPPPTSVEMPNAAGLLDEATRNNFERSVGKAGRLDEAVGKLGLPDGWTTDNLEELKGFRTPKKP